MLHALTPTLSSSEGRRQPARAPSSPRSTATLYDDFTDADLVQRCRGGHAGAWAALVRRYQRLIYTVAMRAGLAEDQAAEAFQATFVRLHEHLPRLRQPEALRAWLVTTAKRETLLLRQRLARDLPLQDAAGERTAAGQALEEIADPDPLPEMQLQQMQEAHRLHRALERLDPRSRQWADLLFMAEEPIPYQEVAARMGSSIGSIGPTRARVLAKLRALLEEES